MSNIVMHLACDCGALEALGELKPTQISKQKLEHVIHYSNIVGSFYPRMGERLIVCSKCNKPALHHGLEDMLDDEMTEDTNT
jgi:hypothetical protein